jgi:opacity protein-like surface antigen
MKLNMKSILTGSAATIALVAASQANASGYYVGLFGGWSTLEDSFDVSTSTAGKKNVFNSTTSSTQLFYSKSTAPTGTSTTKTYFVGYTGSGAPYLDTNTNVHTYGGTANYHTDMHFFASGSATLAKRATAMASRNSFDDGWVVGGSMGWDFGNGWRTELEAAYRANDVDARSIGTSVRTYVFTTYLSHTDMHYSGPAGSQTSSVLYQYTKTNVSTVTNSITGPANIDGDLTTWSFMFNVWYDFDFGDSPLHPFIGGGIGFAHANLDYKVTATGIPNPYSLFGTSFAYRGNGEASDWGFAYQIGAGLGYDLGNGMMLSAQYRYFNTGAMDLSLADQIEVNLESHNFLVGLNIPLGGGN